MYKSDSNQKTSLYCQVFRFALPFFLGVLGAPSLMALPQNTFDTDDWFYKKGSFQGWKYIVIHHSATESGSGKAFHAYHEKQGWGGLAYHFVIGNGKGAKDGQIYQGFRWEKTLTGTHVSTNSWEYNIFGVGICLVGNFQKSQPTNRQWSALVDLTTKIAKEHKIPADHIVMHRKVPYDDDKKKTESTLCPGDKFPIMKLRKEVSARLDDSKKSANP